MKKKSLWLLSIPAALVLLWLLVFGIQESGNASLRDENYIEAQPLSQGLYRLRPFEEERVASIPNIFEYYQDEKGHELPRGWQPPGTEELKDVSRDRKETWIGTMRFDEPPFNDSFVRVMRVTMPDLRKITFKAYFLGIFPVKDTREGYGLFSLFNWGALVKAYHGGNAALEHVPVMFKNDGTPTHTKYLRKDTMDVLTQAIAAGGELQFSTAPLYADTPEDEILRYPTKIFFVD